MQEESSTAVRDKLARQRTELANERTLLAYIRTALGFAIAGVPAVWWLEQLGLQALGVVSLVTSVVILGLGIRRFITIKTQIDRQPD
jgi:inner membrane protein YidH